MTPIRSSKLSPSVESLRSFRPRPTETSSGSATSHSIVNAIGRALLQSAQALPRHRHTLRQACEKFPRRGAVGCRYNPPQLNTGPSGKKLEFLREAVPALRRLAIMANVGIPASVLDMGEAQAAAHALGLEVTTSELRRAEDISPAFDALKGRA